jgi:uncharacterized membrane protein
LLTGGLIVGATFLLSFNGCSPASQAAPSYTLTASAFSPAAITDGNAASTITITPANGPGNGYTGVVALTCLVQGAGSNLNCFFSQNPLVISTHSAVTSIMTVQVRQGTPAAVYSIVVSGLDASNLAPSNGDQQVSLTVM